MQFHLNGFRPGDPSRLDWVNGGEEPSLQSLPQTVDVLIVGCGPTGLTLAAQLAAFPNITTRIIEQKPGPLQMGQADGIACRTLEMFEAFGFSERVLREAYWVNETSFWSPDRAQSQHIARSRVVQDVEDGLSEFPHVILNQARVHDFYLDVMRSAPGRLAPCYSRRLASLRIDEVHRLDPSAHPITANITRVEAAQTPVYETVRARYLVGCDGARSAVRRLLGYTLEGDSANRAWGVMDVLAVTDFPDIRRKATIHSANAGNMLIIPREGGYMVRLYIELEPLAQNQRVAQLEITTEHLVATARKILCPFTLEVREIAWWSIYEIGQRICHSFDDLAPSASADHFPRIFIAGDACHTHSPKAGQGMNVSMQDAFNLGWKLASVVAGRAQPQLLRTYSEERHAIAKDLIEFDHTFSRMFSARPKVSAAAAEEIDPVAFQDYFIRQGRFTAGTATQYRTSCISAAFPHQHLAEGFVVGTRFHSAPVVRFADAKSVELGHTIRADGRWRIFAFADTPDPALPSSELRALCEYLERSADSPLRRFTSSGEDIDAVIEIIAICQQSHHDLSPYGLPSLLLPRKGRYGLIDYEKIYCPDFEKGTNIFDARRVNRQTGALVIVRPDQHIAHVLPLDAQVQLRRFFAGFLNEAS